MDTVTFLKLKFTINTILYELLTLIRSDPKCPKNIIRCYKELKPIYRNLEYWITKTSLDGEELIFEFEDIFRNMLEEYFLSIEKNYLETYGV